MIKLFDVQNSDMKFIRSDYYNFILTYNIIFATTAVASTACVHLPRKIVIKFIIFNDDGVTYFYCWFILFGLFGFFFFFFAVYSVAAYLCSAVTFNMGSLFRCGGRYTTAEQSKGLYLNEDNNYCL